MSRLNSNAVVGFFIGVLCFMTAWVSPSWAAGLLTPKDSNRPALEIKDHAVTVVIEDGYAVTTVDQVFFNPHPKDLEAVYSFPVPEKAAVSQFTMWIDGKPVHGEVLERKKAREVYEDQKSKNKNTGITEQNGYKTFEVSVYPVGAGGETKIRLGYIQPAHVDTGVGRYLYPLEEGGVDEEALAFWSTNEKVSGTFSFDLSLRSGYPIADLRLPNHPQAQLTRQKERWMVHLDNHMTAPSGADVSSLETAQNFPSVNADGDTVLTINNNKVDSKSNEGQVAVDPHFRLNTDIVVYYRQVENLPGAVDLIAYKKNGAPRGTFMLTVTPGMDLQAITEGRDWVFILDISGSMQGKYATLAQGVNRVLKKLSANDRFRIVLFNSRASELTSGFVNASLENVQKYTDAVTAVQPNEGTNLYDGLQLGLTSLDSDRTSSLILVTDGVANVGVTEQKQFIQLIKDKDVRLFTFIMGNSANLPLLDVLTRVSSGFAVSVSNSDDIIGKIMEAQSKVNFQALHGARLNISGVKTSDITPKEIGSVYRGGQLILFGHYFGGGRAAVTLEGKISGENKVYTTEFNFPDIDEGTPEIERLWAYAAIEAWNQEMEDFGESPDMKQSIIDTSVEYGLVTDYTSMVVLEENVFKTLGIDQRNKRRLEEEYGARQTRAASVVVSRRVDSAQPMFTRNRPTFTGGAGAIDPVSLAILAPLLWGLRKRKNK